MYQRVISSFLLIFILSVPHMVSATGRKATAARSVGFEELWKLVLKRSPSVKMAQLKVQGYEAMLTGSKLLHAPVFTLSAHGAPTPKYSCIMPQEWFDMADKGGLTDKEFREKYCIGTNRDDSITLNLDGYALRFQVKAVQPLYTFGKIGYAKAMAAAALKGSKANFAAKKRELRLLVRRAWYARQSANMLMSLVTDAEKVLTSAKTKAEKYEEDGKITPVQMIRLKLGENEILRRKLAIAKLDNISREALKIMTGTSVDVTRELLAPSRVTPPPLKKLFADAIGRLPEVAMLKAVRAVKVSRVGLAKAAFLPDLGFFVRYTHKLSNSDDPKNVYMNDPLHGASLAFGLGLEMKFDPAKMITDLRLARLEVRAVESKIAAAGDLLKMRIVKARQEVIYQIKHMKLLIKGIKLARAWSLAITDQEKIGALKPKEMVDSLTAYYKLKFALIETKYALAMAWAKLNHVIGEKI